MRTGHSPGSRPDGPARPVRSFELMESKLHPPVVRPGIVTRTVLIDRLMAARTPGVISVVAPAGYGKTTLLAQWAERRRPRLAWVSADSRDNDPAVLLTYLAVALDRVEAISPAVFRMLASPAAGIWVVATLTSAIATMDEPVTLILDQADAVTNRDCLDTLSELALSMPAGSQFAIASRDNLAMPVARLHAQGGIVEVGAEDLAMDDPEASSLLRQAGLDLGDGDVRDLVQHSEGWPAGLYLAALAMKAGSPRADVSFAVSGDDRYVGDFLRSEFLDRVSPSEVVFLTRSSILDRMCGPLCDATLATEGSGQVLEQLESRNLLVVPLDRRREWYRYHQLFKELLHEELKRREPEMLGPLHSRVAVWVRGQRDGGRRPSSMPRPPATPMGWPGCC